jgi:hypothetical protein
MTTPDQGKTFDLSDEAAAVLYPDPPTPDPPVIPPDALTPIPPLAQRESALLDIIRMYGSGQTDWPATRQALTGFDYATPPPRVNAPTGPTAGAWYGEVESDVGNPAGDNTWAQLEEAAAAGMLTDDEVTQILQARAGGTGDGGRGSDDSGAAPETM